MPRKEKGKKRERDDGAESASKRRGRASEGDVAMKLGEELGEWTVVGLAGIIISKIQDVNGEYAEPQKRAKAYLTLMLCLLCVARTLTHDIVTGESSKNVALLEKKFLRQSFWFYIHAWEYYVRWILVLLRWRVVAVGVSLSSKYAG